jgi:hypothetical protein
MSSSPYSPVLGFTPELKKYKKEEYAELPKIRDIAKGLLETAFYRYFLRKSQKSCVYPNSLHMLIETIGGYYTDKFSLHYNKAVSPQQYINVLNKHLDEEEIAVKEKKRNRSLITSFVKRIKFWGVKKDLNSEFKKLCTKNIIIFPIDLLYMDVLTNFKYKLRKEGHSMLLIVDTKANKAYLIDPTAPGVKLKSKFTDYPSDYYDIVAYKAKKLVERILKKEYEIEFIDMVCPQFKEQRGTCLSWTMFLAVALINDYERTGSRRLHPYKVINKIMKKYDTQEKLQRVMGQFQHLLIRNVNKIKSIREKIAPDDYLRYLTVGL